MLYRSLKNVSGVSGCKVGVEIRSRFFSMDPSITENLSDAYGETVTTKSLQKPQWFL